MSKFIDITGKKFGRLTVIEKAETRNGRQYWKCLCDCGNEKIVSGKFLRNGHTKSCGCLAIETRIENNKKYKTKRNVYILNNDYGIGYTTNTNREFWFDIEDYEKIKDYCWLEDKYGYIYSSGRKNKKRYFFHRIILGVADKDWKTIQVDHISHNKFDNRKTNLRIVCCSQNAMNRSLMLNNTSGVTGVMWDKKSNKWKSEITINYQKKVLGFFTDFDEAAKARKEAEEKYFKDYSYENSLKLICDDAKAVG